MSNIITIAEQLFDVQKIQLQSSIEGYEMPNNYGIYNTTSKKCLGVVGDVYHPTQPAEILSNLVDCLAANNVDLDAMKYSTLKDGAKVRFTTPFKTIGFKNIAGQQDESVISINLQTGYDGLTKTSLYLSMVRLVCTNGMKANNTEFETSIKNTKGNAGKIGNLCTDISRSLQMADNLQELLLMLNNKTVNTAQVNQFLKDLTKTDITNPETSTRARNIYDDLMSSIELEFKRTGASAWGLLNGVTYYTNHVATATNREDYLFIDKGNNLNKLAQDLVIAI